MNEKERHELKAIVEKYVFIPVETSNQMYNELVTFIDKIETRTCDDMIDLC